MMRRLPKVLLCLLMLLPSWVAADTDKPALITIIIDDLGNNLQHGQRAIDLPGAVTYSFLPFTPFSKRLAEQAHRQGKEIMLHLPMDNSHGGPLGPGGLTLNQPLPLYEQQLKDAIAVIPYVSGINNHTGSRLTANSERMQWLMQSLKHYPLYFVDSRTSAQSVAAATSKKLHIPTLKRDVFLDHEATAEFTDRQFKRLIKIARQRGNAVAIGHPYPSTLSYLEKILPQLDAMNIQLVSPSQLLALNNVPQRVATQTSEAVTEPAGPIVMSQYPAAKADKSTVKTASSLIANSPPETDHCRITELHDVTRIVCS